MPPLKNALADSLQIVFWMAMLVSIFGIFVSLLMGNARLKKESAGSFSEEAGVTLFAEGIAPEVELSTENVPDLIDKDISDLPQMRRGLREK